MCFYLSLPSIVETCGTSGATLELLHVVLVHVGLYLFWHFTRPIIHPAKHKSSGRTLLAMIFVKIISSIVEPAEKISSVTRRLEVAVLEHCPKFSDGGRFLKALRLVP